MTTRTFRCVVCGTAGVRAPGRVCPLHLRASEQQLLVSQTKKPSAWVLGAQPAAAPGPAAAKQEAQPPAMRPAGPAAPVGATELELAGFSQRFYAFIIDIIVASVTAGFLSLFAAASPAAAAFVGLAGFCGYFLLSNSLGQLAGKATLGIKVVDPATGREPGFGKGALRTIGQAMGLFLTFGLGFLIMAGDERNMTMHDHLAGTLVIRRTGAAG
jgi:uncharacterized RDD family membrane protein YckC